MDTLEEQENSCSTTVGLARVPGLVIREMRMSALLELLTGIKSLILRQVLWQMVFKSMLAKLDDRKSVITCEDCNLVFENRLMLENHMDILHKDKVIVKEGKSELESMMKVMS